MARTRPSGTLITNNAAHSTGSFNPMIDLRQGGQNGYIPDYRTFISNSAYVQRNVIPILLEYPRGFDHLPEPEVWIGTLKALVEEQVRTIEGLGGTLTVAYVDQPIGASGEVQEDFSQTTRARSEPTFMWVEKQGRPIQEFFTYWIYYLLGHPDTQVPMITSLEMNKNKRFDFLPDFNTMSCIFIEPDPFHQRVVEAWLCVNMAPKGAGDLNGKRNTADAMSNREISIPFTAMTMMSNGVRLFAQKILDSQNFTGLNVQDRRSSIEKLDADLIAATAEDGGKVGYVEQVDEIATTQNYNSLNNQIDGKSVQHNPDWTLSQGTK